jgi:hypothetical protein
LALLPALNCMWVLYPIHADFALPYVVLTQQRNQR